MQAEIEKATMEFVGFPLSPTIENLWTECERYGDVAVSKKRDRYVAQVGNTVSQECTLQESLERLWFSLSAKAGKIQVWHPDFLSSLSVYRRAIRRYA